MKPFPFTLSVGTDIVSVVRIKNVLTRHPIERLLNRLFTAREKLHFHDRYPDLTGSIQDVTRLNSIAQHLAGRFAAKEAIIKACHWRKLYLHDVLVLSRGQYAGVYGVVLDKVAVKGSTSLVNDVQQVEHAEHDAINGQIVQVSISHEVEYATATCIAATEPLEHDVGGEAAARSPEA